MEFDFRQELIEEGEIDEVAFGNYVEELIRRFAESPEGEALAGRGIMPGHYVGFFLDYALRYTGLSPAEMDTNDIREALGVMAGKVTARPEDFDRAIPELEGFCDFVGRAFAFEKAEAWKRAVQGYAPEFRRAIRDPRRWGMAKSIMMEGMSRGYDLSTVEGVNQWVSTKQAEQADAIEAETGLEPGRTMSPWSRLRRAIGMAAPKGVSGAGGEATRPLLIGDLRDDEPDFSVFSSAAVSKRHRKKEKSRRKQAGASRRQARR